MSKHRITLTTLFLFGLMLLIISSLAINPEQLQAQGNPLPTATPYGTPPPPTASPYPPGGTLILQMENPPVEGWTIVQWQDANGGWHDVEGWRSHFTNDYVGWWVAPADFSDGPFRWLLLASENGPELASSAPFSLPGYLGHVLLVELSLE